MIVFLSDFMRIIVIKYCLTPNLQHVIIFKHEQKRLFYGEMAELVEGARLEIV